MNNNRTIYSYNYLSECFIIENGIYNTYQRSTKVKVDFENVVNLSEEFAIIKELYYSLFEETTEVLLRIKLKIKWNYQDCRNGKRIQPHINSEAFLLEFDKDLIIPEYFITQFKYIDTQLKTIQLHR